MEPRLIVITDRRVAAGELLEQRLTAVLRGARAGTVLVQLRDRDWSVRERLVLGQRLRALTREWGQGLAVNDRIDLALLLDADAIHLGEGSVRPGDARRIWGSRFISRACHDADSARSQGADAVVLSPVVAPRKGAPALGLAALRRAKSEALLYALGGVDGTTAARCLEAGADGVAVIGAALDGRDPTPLLAALGID